MTMNSNAQRNVSIWCASIRYPGCNKPVYCIASWSLPVLEGAIKRFIEDGWRADEFRPIVSDGPTLETADRIRDRIKSFQQDGEYGWDMVSFFDDWLRRGNKHSSFIF